MNLNLSEQKSRRKARYRAGVDAKPSEDKSLMKTHDEGGEQATHSRARPEN
jgi:hypothetical protein